MVTIDLKSLAPEKAEWLMKFLKDAEIPITVDDEEAAWEKYNKRMDEIEKESDNDKILTHEQVESEIAKWKSDKEDEDEEEEWSPEEIAEHNRLIKEALAGETISHEEAKKRMSQW